MRRLRLILAALSIIPLNALAQPRIGSVNRKVVLEACPQAEAVVESMGDHLLLVKETLGIQIEGLMLQLIPEVPQSGLIETTTARMRVAAMKAQVAKMRGTVTDAKTELGVFQQQAWKPLELVLDSAIRVVQAELQLDTILVLNDCHPDHNQLDWRTNVWMPAMYSRGPLWRLHYPPCGRQSTVLAVGKDVTDISLPVTKKLLEWAGRR